MPKRKPTSQPDLFKPSIPSMPEGYYSPGPNPNLRRFVEEHAKLYDMATDDYDLQTFDEPVTVENRRDPINDLHIYWSKKPYKAICQYIRHYTQPGDLVFDPFCGSGGTALAALMEGRAAIAIDLSPAATFITKNYCTPVDVDELQRAFEQLQTQVKPEMDWLYETRCDRCDGRATTAYTVYSYVFECPRCLAKVPLFDCVEAKGEREKRGKGEKGKRGTGEVEETDIKACPHCHTRGIVEEISTRGKRFDPVPVLVSYLCEEGCKPQRAERRHNDADPKKRDYFERYDLGKLREIETKPIPHWYPPHRMMNVESDTEPWGDKWRAGTSSFRTVAGLFTKRNLWALAVILSDINKSSGAVDAMRFAFSGALFNATKMYQQREAGGGPQKGTYYIPQIFREVRGWTLFEQKVLNLARAAEILAALNKPAICISTQSATCLDSIPGNSIDYIFTDPPYADKIQYGELNFVWEAWLDANTQWHNQEIIVNKTRGRTDVDWAHLMRQAMSECYRVLKPGRWISLCYHDTSEGTWQLVQDLMAEVGFIPESSEAALYIDTGQKSFNQLMAEKVTKRDLVINFRKPRPNELLGQLVLFGDEDAATFAEKSRAILRDALEAHPGSTADRLYDELVSRMVRKGEFERHRFDDLLHSVAEEVNGRWYLLETADQADAAESAKEETAAKRLEAKAIEMGEGDRDSDRDKGVHYSDLFEWYLPVKDKPRRKLADWLPEYFIKTAEGTWRPPANAEERAQLQALRTGGALRRIKRFANALIEGTPPNPRDYPPNTASAADWIRLCRRAGLYELGRVLYEKGNFNFQELSDEAQMEVEEDYQVCARRTI